MTTTQYAAYQTAVQSFLTSNHVKLGCHSPAAQDSEPFFSHRACECCGSRLVGNRETYSFAYNANAKDMLGRRDKGPHTFEADICTDCVHYLSNGQLDDMTMMEMSNDTN